MITRGSVAFATLVRAKGGQQEWAALLGMSVRAIDSYMRAERRPNDALRDRIEELALERGALLPKEWWETKPDPTPPRSEPPPPGAPDEPLEAATADDPAALAARLKATILRLQRDLDGARGYELELAKQARIANELAGAIARLASLTGTRLTERAILSSPLWAELLERIATALAPWPDALRAVGAALQPIEKDPKA